MSAGWDSTVPVLGSAQVVELRRLDAQADALGRLVDQARLDRGGGDSGSAMAARAVSPSQLSARSEDCQVNKMCRCEDVV